MDLEVAGVQYSNFTTASCEIRLDALSNTFNFTATAPDGQPLPFKGGDACKVVIEGETILTGFIEVINVNYSASDHNITISGRDKTADLLDSSIDSINDIRAENLTLKSLIEKIIGQLGLDVQVIDEVEPEPFSETEDIAAPEPGDNAFEFIEKYAKKRQVLLTSNGDGDIVISTNWGQTAEGAVQHIIGADDNNVLSADFSYDTTGRYNVYKITSGMNPIALNLAGETENESVVNQKGSVIDSDIRSGRQLIIMSENPFSDEPCEKRAKWEADIRRARGLVYSATVPGFRVGGDSGDMWRINRVYQIIDDYVGKVEPMLCNSVVFNYDADNGRTTTLGFVGRNAYTLFIDPNPIDEVASNVA